MIPVANAALTAIVAPGAAADYDVPATAGTNRWQGRVGAYVVDELVRDLTPGSVTQIRRTSIVIPGSLARQVKQGDTLQFTYQNTAQARVVADVRITEIADTARIVLEKS